MTPSTSVIGPAGLIGQVPRSSTYGSLAYSERTEWSVETDRAGNRRILIDVGDQSVPNPTSPIPVGGLEDWRGVDISQIRRQIRLTPAERLRHMTHVANQLRRIQRAAHRER